MWGDEEEKWGRDANTTRWDPLQLLSLHGQGMAEPSSESPLLSPGAASTVPRYVGWFGEGRGDGAALARRKRARGFRGKHRSMLLVWHHRFCTQTGGWGRKEATSLRSSACFSLVLPARLLPGSSPSTHTGSPTTLQTWETTFPILRANTSRQRDCSLRGERMLVLRMDAGTTFVPRGFRGEQGDMGILSTISPTAQPKGG